MKQFIFRRQWHAFRRNNKILSQRKLIFSNGLQESLYSLNHVIIRDHRRWLSPLSAWGPIYLRQFWMVVQVLLVESEVGGCTNTNPIFFLSYNFYFLIFLLCFKPWYIHYGTGEWIHPFIFTVLAYTWYTFISVLHVSPSFTFSLQPKFHIVGFLKNFLLSYVL